MARPPLRQRLFAIMEVRHKLQGRGQAFRLRILAWKAAPFLLRVRDTDHLISEHPERPSVALRVATLDGDPGIRTHLDVLRHALA